MKTSAAQARRATQVNTIAPAPSGAGTDILALTEDDLFLLTVRRVVTLPNRVWHATSDSQAADMLLSSPCAVALIDYALVQSRLAAVLARLGEQFPELACVAAGEPVDKVRVARYLDSGHLQGFIAKANAAEGLARVLEAGINRHLELRSAARASASSGARARGPLLAAGLGAALVSAAVAGWFLTRGPADAPGGASTAATAASATGTKTDGAGQVEAALHRAREAFEAGRYLEPKGGSALDHYRAALAAEPGNPEARDGVRRVAEVMLARAEAALLQQQTREAAAALSLAKGIEPGHPRVAFLEAQLTRELDRTQAAQQEATRTEAANQKLAGLIKLGNERLNQDRLVEPQNDSARYYFNAARELDAASLLTQQGLRSLASRMMQKSSQAVARGNAAEAEQWLTQARQLGVSGLDFAKLERDIKSAQRARSGEAERLAGLARERLGSGRLLDPEADSALFYVQALQSQYPAHGALPAVLDSLRAQLLTGAEQAVARKDLALAGRMLEEARAVGASGAGLEAATAAVASARRKAEALAKAQPVRDDMVIRSVKPDYPQKAERREIEGFVDMHFTVDAAGEVVDVAVIEAQPADVFEDAAVRALKKWKFRPLQIDGEAVSQRLSLRMRFAMQD